MIESEEALLLSLNAGKISTILGSYGEHLCAFEKNHQTEGRETGDIVDKVSERERERERSHKSYRIVLVRIPTYIIGFDSIHLASIWLWL